MFSYTTKNINIISFIVSIVLYISINQIVSIINATDFQSLIFKHEVEESVVEENIKEKDDNKIIVEEKTNISTSKNEKQKKVIWKIEIPCISLSAEISEGTTTEVMNNYVGHFTNTSKQNGNIGLAAHNRGYPVNYFQNIKKLKKGDEIKYQYDKYKKTYIVDKILIIDDTDWTKLEQTEENTITLITCVENEPQYRRCIQGTEK